MDLRTDFDALVARIRDEVRAEKFDAAGRIEIVIKSSVVLGMWVHSASYSPEGSESSDDDIVESGTSAYEALGCLVMNHPELFPIEIRRIVFPSAARTG